MEYTVKETAEMFRTTPLEVSTVIAKGGIKGIRVNPSDTGIEYLLNDQAIDQLGAIFGKMPEEEEKEPSVYEAVKEGFSDAIVELESAGVLSEIIVKALDTDEFQQRINRAVYQAMRGHDMEKNRDLIPQRYK